MNEGGTWPEPELSSPSNPAANCVNKAVAWWTEFGPVEVEAGGSVTTIVFEDEVAVSFDVVSLAVTVKLETG
ncbi:MAG: hypothetical protein JO172_01820 [Hyphomicrobiales bacterium]|nr:hypothetical protein [Hyphomicrobiales bacterium]